MEEVGVELCRPEINSLQKLSKTIDDLPAEMLTEIFKYLTHTGKLIARLVCVDWNRQIPSLLKDCSHFLVSSAKAHKVLTDSDVDWKELVISEIGFAIPLKSRNYITTLNAVVHNLKECKELVGGLPYLINLDLNFRNSKISSEEDMQPNQQLIENFKSFAGKLNVLSVSTDMKSCRIILPGFLQAFDADTLCLTDLEIRVNDSSTNNDEVEDDLRQIVFTELYRIILKSVETMRNLDLNFSSTLQAFLFPELISKLCELKDFKLDLIDRYKEKKTDSEFKIDQNFKTRMEAMKHIDLPWSPDPDFCEEIMNCVPRNVLSLANVHAEHVYEIDFSEFTKLETMSISSKRLPVFTGECPSLKQLHVECVEELESHCFAMRNEYAEEFFQSIGTSFIKLTDLRIGNGFELFEWDLQLIIENLESLRILHVDEQGYEGTTQTSDVSVTGIDEEYSSGSLELRKLYLYQEVPEEKKSGLPLSSLKLERLVLIGPVFSDFGIYHGLRFGPTLRELTFKTTGEISDWRLYWLGVGNPGLESFNGSFERKLISSEGPQILRDQLPLIKETNKFKFGE